MELTEEEVKGYSDSREEEEEEEATTEMMNMNIPSSRGGESESNRHRLHQQEQEGAGPNLRKQLDLMELSLGTAGTSSSSSSKQQEVVEADPNLQLQGGTAAVEKEHMFDKVVTPSDVGKLNRLVIPKQHAEKYFPLDSSSNDKGLLLNFEDRNGKLWRFRYSYWNSSQSYVMTKGWSRFVKEKKLDAGDIVSFQRGLGDLFRHRLYIDWRRRPDHPPHHHHHHHHHSPLFLPIRWGGRLYSLPSPPAAAAGSTLPPPRHHDHFPQQVNYNSHMYSTFHHPHVGGSTHGHEMNIPGPASLYYLRSTPSASMLDHRQHQDRLGIGMGMGMPSTSSSASGVAAPVIIDSVPVAHHHQHHHHHHHQQNPGAPNAGGASAGKRLRLFGVNMECASSSSSPGGDHHQHLPTMPPNSSLPSSAASFGDQNQRETSVLFDLDPSLQYHHHHHHQ